MDTLTQLGELLLRSIPTIIFLMVVWTAYRHIVQRKLRKVRGIRHTRTDGAMKEAHEQIAKAEARTAEYERRLREARSQVYQTEEARRRHIMEKRSAAINEARQQADERVKHAQAGLQRDTEEARLNLGRQTESLADEIIDSILKPLAVTEGL